ncbi:unnamed protein product [Bursaphelenchus okinawaensis]|uniref:Uncharacterized protein n=1 Tax=Bursaphelenchus okinawaensis TaxID=465554 RepID=A0A811KE46_9BILA|nr:unnamed protein product [Bursaphelenchus okinawaensis]CAG9099342.1 unnamed protein product [Bursaphelenchus okinawaensis]
MFISVILLLSLISVHAIPRRTNEPWTVILCKFADQPNYEPKTKEWVRQWIMGDHPDSIKSYFEQVSNGVYTIEGSEVHGWLQLPFKQKEILALAKIQSSFTLGSESSFLYFDKIKELCIKEAERNGIAPHRQKITIVNGGTNAVFDKQYGVLLTPQLMNTSVLTHEMVHSFFIGHSYSDRQKKVFQYALNGEYDDRYDLMSTANAFMHPSKYGMAGPGLNGAHLDFLGWLPMDRMLYFGRDGRQNYTLRLSSLSVAHNATRGWLFVMIPYDRSNSRNFYTVELRTPHNYDRGIQQASILIHRVQRAGESYYSVLVTQKDYYELTEGTEWVKFLDFTTNGYQVLRVTVKKVYSTDADVTISSTFSPTECRLGELTSRLREPTAGVEHVCLEKVRNVEISDIRRQVARQHFYSDAITVGANSCRTGKLWRAIDAYDYVCVDPKRQEQVLSESEHQTERYNQTTQGCVDSFVPREAFRTDKICVSEEEKNATLSDNVEAHLNLKFFEFFNGVDTVGP